MSRDRDILPWAVQAAVLLLAAWLRWPWPDPGWTHIDEHIFVERTLGFWGGDLNPHFFNYPTLQLYIVSALQYLYYLAASPLPLAEFIALRYFVDGSDLMAIARGATTLMAVGTVAAVCRIGARLYGTWGGLSAGLLLALLPLHVRFSHLATTDIPAAFWLSLALLFAVRIAQEGRGRDFLLAGLCAGLAAATKYPAALVCVAIAVAARGRPPKGLAQAAAAAAAAFALASPYVLLDPGAFWRDFAAMGGEHLLGPAGGERAGAYLLGSSLRYGIGLAATAGLFCALAYRPRAWRRGEEPVLAAFAAFAALSLVADSVFMRYAVPLAAPSALLCTRLLAAQTPRAWAAGLLLLAAEPLYASQQLRGLLSGADTRAQAAAYLRAQAPDGGRISSSPAGLAPLLHYHAIAQRQQAFRLSFGADDLTRAYGLLARRDDLPPLYGFWLTEELTGQIAPPGTAAVDSAWVLRYTHPLLAAEPTPHLARARWHVEFSPGATAAMVFDRVDRYYAPIGGFAHAAATGPAIAVGTVGLTRPAPPMPPARDLFALLHQLRRADSAAAQRDWRQVVDINTRLMRQFTYLRQLVPPSHLSKLCSDLGTAWAQLGDPSRSRHYRDQARLLLQRG